MLGFTAFKLQKTAPESKQDNGTALPAAGKISITQQIWEHIDQLGNHTQEAQSNGTGSSLGVKIYLSAGKAYNENGALLGEVSFPVNSWVAARDIASGDFLSKTLFTIHGESFPPPDIRRVGNQLRINGRPADVFPGQPPVTMERLFTPMNGGVDVTLMRGELSKVSLEAEQLKAIIAGEKKELTFSGGTDSIYTQEYKVSSISKPDQENLVRINIEGASVHGCIDVKCGTDSQIESALVSWQAIARANSVLAHALEYEPAGLKIDRRVGLTGAS